MKKLLLLLMALAIVVISCKKDDDTPDSNTLSGDQSPHGQVGNTFTTLIYPGTGVTDFSAVVTTLSNGVSEVSGSATVDNELLKNFYSNFPGVTVSGNTLTATGQKFKATSEGIEYLTGPSAGIWVKYASNVGDTYQINSTGKVRTVVSKSTTDDYNYSMMLIKVLKVEEDPSYLARATGVSKVTYVANHKFGLVGLMFTLDDGTSVTFPIYSAAEVK